MDATDLTERTDTYFLLFLEARSLQSAGYRGWVLAKALFLAGRRLPSRCVFRWPFPGAHVESVSSLVSLLPRTLTPSDQGPTRPASFHLVASLAPSVHRQPHWVVRTSVFELGE